MQLIGIAYEEIETAWVANLRILRTFFEFNFLVFLFLKRKENSLAAGTATTRESGAKTRRSQC